MRFAIRFVRYRGRILPPREFVNRPELVGELRVEETFDEDLRRYVRTACLRAPGSVLESSAFPRLHDVRIVGMSTGAFSLSGLERLEGADYAQSWIVSVPDP